MKLAKIAKLALAAFCAGCFCLPVQAQLAKLNPIHANVPENAQKQDCLACHQSYDAVAAKTAKTVPNPHDSHRGEVNCTNCHSVKDRPRFECNDCHELNIKMKGEVEQ